jgi:hypothetical protein
MQNLKLPDAWGVLLAESNQRPSEDDITPLLSALRSEIDYVRQVLQSINQAGEVAKPYIKQALNLTSATGLKGNFNANRKGNLTSDFLLFWNLSAETLPRSEEIASEEAWNDFNEQLTALEKAVIAEGVPPALRLFVGRQIKLMREAIVRSRISGGGQVRDAVEKGLGELVTRQQELVVAAAAEPEKAAGLMSKLRKVWTTGATVSSQADDIANGIGLVHKTWEKVAPFLQNLVP